MKLTLLLGIFLCTTLLAFGKKPIRPIDRSIKLEIPNMLYGDYSLSYEREIMQNSSLSLRLGYLKPFGYALKTLGLSSTQLPKGSDASLEWRFFVAGKKKADLQGLYVAPYIRYAKLNLKIIDEIDFSPVNVRMKYTNIGGGLQIGYQGKFKSKNEFMSHIVYDFHLIGGGVDNHILTIAYNGLKDSQNFEEGTIQNEVLKVLEDYPLLINKLNIPQLNNLINVPIPIVLPGLRAGFSIGYSF